jgi:NADH-quinone oxidoreductase subunit L
MFHLFTHAFFKALLFLGAGSVMHAMGGVIDLRSFGGLRRLMPITHWTFLFGCLALAGMFPFAGFWSKDAILAAAYERGQHEGLYLGLYWAGTIVALLTAFYTFRAFFLTFYGPERIPPEAGSHAHESPGVMTVPLMILAVGSLVVGAYYYSTGSFAALLERTPMLAYSGMAVEADAEAHAGGAHMLVSIVGTGVAAAGIGLAALLYLGREALVASLALALAPLYRLSYGKLFIDAIYFALVVWPLEALSRLSYWIDSHVIDGLVDFVGRIPPAVARSLRPLGSGLVQFYAVAMVWGVVVLIVTLLIWPALVALK